MKKILYSCIAAIIVLTITWGGVIASEPPTYSQPRFHSIEELMEWIETTDAATFQGGRFYHCLVSIRNRGDFFVPSFQDRRVRLNSISVMQNYARPSHAGYGGRMIVAFHFRTPDGGTFSIGVNEMSPGLIEVYEREGIAGYFKAGVQIVHDSFQILERVIPVKDLKSDSTVNRTISYVAIDRLYNIVEGSPSAMNDFIIDGMEIMINYRRAATREYLGGLTLNTTPITYRPAPLTTRTIRFTMESSAYAINGTRRTLDGVPFVDRTHDRVMVPLRAVSEGLGAEVDWSPIGHGGVVTITTQTGTHHLNIGEPLPDGMGMPEIVNGRAFVPLRFVAELLGATARWDAANSAAYIYQEVVVD